MNPDGLFMKTKLFVAASSFLMTAGCFESSCNDKVLEEVRSPDGKYIATIFESDCGATTAYSRHVLLRASESRFDGASAENIVFTARVSLALRLDGPIPRMS